MEKLAINGGPKVRTEPFPFCTAIGREEVSAAVKVLKSGVLSQYIGSSHPNFYGGPEVHALEGEWARYFRVKHAVSVNSATSALICAVGAVGIGPGDEVIVTPYSMSISATAPLFYGALPVFADIEKDYFCLNPKSLERKISKRTRAIIVVDLLGQPYDAAAINGLAKKHKLIVIEDASQAPGAKYKGRYAGALGDIGVYSLNYHKHIHTGEGGLLVTNNDKWAERARLIRNHAESVAGGRSAADLTNLLGYNFRMNEVEAAIARQQLKKLKRLLRQRARNVVYLYNELVRIPFLRSPGTRPGASHVYYLQPFLFDEKKAGVPRNKFTAAVRAELPLTAKRENEGVLIDDGYVKPLYLLPIFQKQICFGKDGYPFALPEYRGRLHYQAGLAPTAERLYERELFLLDLMKPGMSRRDLDDVAAAFCKVADNIDELKK